MEVLDDSIASVVLEAACSGSFESSNYDLAIDYAKTLFNLWFLVSAYFPMVQPEAPWIPGNTWSRHLGSKGIKYLDNVFEKGSLVTSDKLKQ